MGIGCQPGAFTPLRLWGGPPSVESRTDVEEVCLAILTAANRIKSSKVSAAGEFVKDLLAGQTIRMA